MILFFFCVDIIELLMPLGNQLCRHLKLTITILMLYRSAFLCVRDRKIIHAIMPKCMYCFSKGASLSKISNRGLHFMCDFFISHFWKLDM